MQEGARIRAGAVRCAAVCVAVLSIASCAGVPRTDNPQKAYLVSPADGLLERYAPIFVLQTWEETYNRIGAPAADLTAKGRERIYVDHSRPVLFAQTRSFATARGSYTNLIYRVHFERVPLPHLTVGRNVGLLAVITLDNEMRPVLVTTVHTCGCYLAFVPTTYLSPDAYPEGWETGRQEVHGEILPGRLRYPEAFEPAYRPVIYVRDETHRVMDIGLVDEREAVWRYDVVPATVEPMEALDRLPVNGGTTSFFETGGRRKGFVKGAGKPLERLMISWWALDWRVGEDKKLTEAAEMNTVFYTSLKPWRRSTSDMWPFADFLAFWGWRL